MDRDLSKNALYMLSPVRVRDAEAEPLVLPRKLTDGVAEFAAQWRGPVTLLLPTLTHKEENLDFVPVERAALNFSFHPFPNELPALRAALQGAALVLVPLVPWFRHVPQVCAELGLPFVIDADYSPDVAEQIVRAGTRNPILRWRRLLYVRRLHPRYRAIVRAAAGAHLLGVNAYRVYAPLNRSPLLYFDTRMRRDMLANAELVNQRATRLRTGAPLRLVYSGRWLPIKGVVDLPRVAAALTRRGIPYEMEIFGDGSCEPQLRRAVTEERLEHVHLRGALPFAELMRYVTAESDLFVCCHRQGDPSSTFVEMLSAGVPLVGYNREGLEGILDVSRAGWLTPADDPDTLAARIAELHCDREALVRAAQTAAEFSKDYNFQDMVQRRVAHLEAVLRAKGDSA